MEEVIYDTAIIGGGIAGLTLSINLAMSGRSVILFEKEKYPFHKVCGEYISLESHSYLQSLGMPLQNMNLPVITKLEVTSPSGNKLSVALPLGGFGISRYKIDNDLKEIAIKQGVILLESCKAENIIFSNGIFKIETKMGVFKSRVCCGSFGKKSNFDVKWQRGTEKKNAKNYIGVKYHITAKSDEEVISLHNFKDGYCGMSKIEDNKYCLCYLTTAKNVKQTGSIKNLEDIILSANPFLKNILNTSEKLFVQPVTISGITFHKKQPVENHVIFTGDAAGMITPLCGNGMSMAMHAGKIAAGYIKDFLDGKITRQELEDSYKRKWASEFNNRLRAGRMIQRLFGKVWMSELFVNIMKRSPGMSRWLIGLTHGKPF
jgi:flavin-dependent dehydrogenase